METELLLTISPVHTGEIQNGAEVKRVKWEDPGIRIPVYIMGREQGISVSWAVEQWILYYVQ